jgi:phosphoglucosamine mutase
VHVLHAAPDGVNINAACGATHPEELAAAVVALGADAGLAFDGDADRCIAVDHTGAVVDGDHVIAVAALDLRARGRLTGDTVVTTVMANLGFRNAMRASGIEVVETPVGDRYVLEALDAGGLSLGGEQSGHVIYRDLATTGDGVLTGLLLLDVVHRSGTPLAELAAAAMTRLPQVLVNVRLPPRDPQLLEDLAPAFDAASTELGDRGRVLVRASGTEPLIRVMVEAPTHDEASDVANRLADLVREAAHP